MVYLSSRQRLGKPLQSVPPWVVADCCAVGRCRLFHHGSLQTVPQWVVADCSAVGRSSFVYVRVALPPFSTDAN